MLEVKYLDSTEVTIHVDTKLIHRGDVGSYTSYGWLTENSRDPLTEVGKRLHERLATLPGAHPMYGQYGFMLQVPSIHDLTDVLNMVRDAVSDDVEFGTTLGEDAFTKPEFITNPTREEFGANIERSLEELRQHSTRDIAEAENLVERLESLIKTAKELGLVRR